MERNFIKVDKWGSCLWGIDDAGRLFINEGTAGDIAVTGVPWEEERHLIKEAAAIGKVTFPEGATLAGMFKGCKSLERADLSGFDTTGIRDMHAMFDGCVRLRELDLSSFDTTSCSDMSKMFARCARLTDILMGDKFSLEGDGTTSCGRLAVKTAGSYKRGRVIAAEGSSVFYHENAGRDVREERKTVPEQPYTIEGIMFSAPEERFIFTGWNTRPDGTGHFLKPGATLNMVDEDIDLYAVWASAPEIGEVRPPAEFTFGETIPFELPEIVSANDTQVTGYLEVSPTGEEGSWQAIDHNTLLPVSCDGWLLRLCAANSVGTTASNAVKLHIRKANIDMSGVRWAEDPDMTYDGETKKVWVEGLPAGVTPVYQGNTGTEAGRYTAAVSLEYDQDNFNEPIIVSEHEWVIKQAEIDMSAVRWDYEEAFTYDGSVRTVSLKGLPEGVAASYEGNEARDAGVYTATASLTYDSVNYEKPQNIAPCAWEIKKAAIDPDTLKWSGYGDFVYDGQPKSVCITNLPEDAEIEYDGAVETPAGKYLARAAIRGSYYATGPVEYEWEIDKASYDMSGAHWVYSEPFRYNGETHTVVLEGVPEELGVRYQNHKGTSAGDYSARAMFINPDTHNYYTPDDMVTVWSIIRKVPDMSGVRWDYQGPFTYDGELKKVELTGLPEGVHADYEGSSAFNAGVYNAHAVLKYDSDNLEVSQPADCQWKIDRARIDTSGIHWDYTDAFTYDGGEHGVYLAGVPEGLSVDYQDNLKIEAGKYAASATLTPNDPLNYETPEISGCTWAINRAQIEKGTFEWTDSSDFVYDGREKTVEITSDIGDDITVEYAYNVQKNAGRYFAKAIFSPVDAANYIAPHPVGYSWSIEKASYDMAGVVWDYTSPFTYDGSRKTVQLIGVPEGLQVSYSGNTATDAGDYTAIARFKVTDTSNYDANIPDMTLNWSINKAAFDLSSARWQEDRTFTYNGADRAVRLTGLPDGLEPVYTDNLAAGAGEYTARAVFNYDEKNYEKPEIAECRWSIEKSPVDVSQITWDYEEPFVYDGTEKAVLLKGIPEDAYAEYSNSRAMQAGTYIAAADVVSFDTDNFTPGRMDNLTWRIEKGEYDMSHVYWDYSKPFTYDGTEHTVALKGLPAGVSPVYRNNAATDAGTYEATVTFRIADERNYKVPEFESLTWTVNKADYDMSLVQWNYGGEFRYTGRMNEVLLRGLPDGVRAVYSGNAAAETGSYEATAELIPYDQDNYNKPSVGSCKWQIVKADYEMSAVRWDYSGAKTYNGRPQNIMLEHLPNGVTAAYSGNEATDVGTYTAKATLSVSDGANYNTPAVPDCDWEISRADYDMTGASWNYAPGALIYDGERKSVELEHLPENVTASYEGNSAVRAGDYVATAAFTTSDPNFSAPDTVTFPWSIGRAQYDMSQVKWDYTSEFTYDGSPKRVELAGLPEGVSVEYEDNSATDAGTYTAVARFSTDTTNFSVPEDMTCTWVINKADPDIRRVRWDYSQSYVYDGSVRRVELAGIPDTITASYSGNEASVCGRYTAHADLIPVNPGNYNAPSIADCTWEITKADYDMSDARWVGDLRYMYDGTEKGIHIEGLPEGVEPRYTGNTETQVGTYTAEAALVYDEHNYNPPSIGGQTWCITKASYNLSEVSWDYKGDFVYDGSEKKVALTGLPAGIEPVYSGNTGVDAGDYEAWAELGYDERNYEKPEVSGISWHIDMADVPVDIADIRWDYDGPFVYDGTPKGVAIAEVVTEPGFFDRLRGKKPEVRLAGVPEGFDVEYENNTATDAGVYHATARLVNRSNPNYNTFNVNQCRWEIVKAVPDMSSVRWDYEGSFTYDGSEKSVHLAGVPDVVKVTYTGNSETEAGEYEAMASLEPYDPVNYETPKPVKGCWWQIDRARYDMSGAHWVYNDDLVYDGREKVVEIEGLPEGVKVETYRGSRGLEAGNYLAEAVLTYRNADNFEEPVMPNLKWRIHKKKIDTSAVRWNYEESTLFVYDEKPKEVRLVGVPSEVEVVYIDSSKINAGSYTARARLTYDTRNCEADEIADLKWKIEKANYDTTHVHWNYDRPFAYDGYEKSIYLSNVPKSIDVRYRDNKAIAVGTYTAKAYLTYDSENYNSPDIDTTIDWEIVPAARD